jgi:hypothetical protein
MVGLVFLSGATGGGDEHPRGTLAVVAIFGLLFALGWLALYFLEFLPRGAPTP